eukprot:4602804-Heterocapsa_arctica.AAC.1
MVASSPRGGAQPAPSLLAACRRRSKMASPRLMAGCVVDQFGAVVIAFSSCAVPRRGRDPTAAPSIPPSFII